MDTTLLATQPTCAGATRRSVTARTVAAVAGVTVASVNLATEAATVEGRPAGGRAQGRLRRRQQALRLSIVGKALLLKRETGRA